MANPDLHWDGKNWYRWDGDDWVLDSTLAPPSADQPRQAPGQGPPPGQRQAPVSESHRSKAPVITAIAVGAVLVAAGAAFVVTQLGSDDSAASPPAASPPDTSLPALTSESPAQPKQAAAGPVLIGPLEPVVGFAASTGKFLKSPKGEPPNGNTITGDAQGIYVGEPEVYPCDRKKLKDQLENNQESSTWAKQVGTTEGIAEYIDSTTPVNLRYNTYVTIGYPASAGEAAHQEPAVLKAGTAVLVNTKGVPVVRCATGNPLSSAGGQTPEDAVAVTAGTPVTQFTLVTSDGSDYFLRPVGPPDPDTHDTQPENSAQDTD